MFEYQYLVPFLISFCTVFYTVPKLIPFLKEKGLTGLDVNKEEKVEVAAIGGIAIQLGFYLGLMSFILIFQVVESHILIFIMVSFGIGIIGIIDDIIILRQSYKAILPFFVAIPTGFFLSSSIPIPFFGFFEFGLLMLFLSPFGITCGANASNMLEGFNGLGVGLLSIITFILIVLMFYNSNDTGLVLAIPLLGSLLSFLYYNKYPASIFPGDSTMIFSGGCIVIISYLSNLRAECIFLLLPFIIEFFLKARYKFSTQCFCEYLDNDIMVYNGNISSLTHLAMKYLKLTEKQLVNLFYLFQLSIGLFVIFLTTINVF